MSGSNPIWQQLEEVIRQRKSAPVENSYTAQLLSGGVDRIGEKILEEAREVVEAAGEPDDPQHRHLVHEAADLLFHLCVMLGHCDVPIAAVEDELARRFGQSGLEEKASRASRGKNAS
ncbi:MAG: phosphoribosyl-ATP diphosphatase [Pirellulales bacterium]